MLIILYRFFPRVWSTLPNCRAKAYFQKTFLNWILKSFFCLIWVTFFVICWLSIDCHICHSPLSPLKIFVNVHFILVTFLSPPPCALYRIFCSLYSPFCSFQFGLYFGACFVFFLPLCWEACLTSFSGLCGSRYHLEHPALLPSFTAVVSPSYNSEVWIL